MKIQPIHTEFKRFYNSKKDQGSYGKSKGQQKGKKNPHGYNATKDSLTLSEESRKPKE